MDLKNLRRALIMFSTGIGFAAANQTLFAGTTFVAGLQDLATNIFCSISDQGLVTQMDQSASLHMERPKG